MAMPDIPMYVFTGFLESGKTKFIQETLEDERFNTGERTLLLVFEEGEEEYDVSTYPHKEVYEQVLDYEDLSPEMLTDLQKKYRATRIWDGKWLNGRYEQCLELCHKRQCQQT